MRRISRIAAVFLMLGVMTFSAAAEVTHDSGLIKNQESPHARLHSVDLGAVAWTDGFWARQFQTCRDVTVPRLWELAADPEKGHVLENFRIAAGLADGEVWGCNWHDAWIYKWIESACYVETQSPDPALMNRVDEVIAVIAAAQQPDGYLATQVTLRDLPRFEQKNRHELYTMGHLLTAACAHHRITGKDNFLAVARRVADYVHSVYGALDADPALANCPVNPSMIMGAVELYRTTGEKRYLELAGILIDNRGKKRGPIGRTEWGAPLGGTDLNQDRIPLRQSTEVVGHAVFYTYLFAGAADAYMETGEQALMTALNRLWDDLVTTKMYVTGGVSPVHKGLSNHSFKPGERTITNDEVHEAVGLPYELPNATAYNETCGQIGNIMWNWRMLAVTGEPRFAEIMERTIYNSVLSGVNVEGKGWSYTNPLCWHGPEHELLSQDSHQRFDPGEVHICCPTNLMRTVASWHGCLYTTSDDGLWVHHYGANHATINLHGGQQVSVSQETDYPWDGHVRLRLDEVASRQPLTIRLRIPEWAQGARVSAGQKVLAHPVSAKPGTYATLRAVWQAGDVIDIELPMPVRMLVADPRIEPARNQVAVARGPVVYCMESTDLPDGVTIDQIRVPIDATWTTTYKPDLLGGVTVLETEATTRPYATSGTGTYRVLEPARAEKFTLRLIPYYAWNNRGEPKMSVWIPLD